MKTKTILLSFTLAFAAQVLKAQTFQWVKQLGGAEPEYAYSIAVDASGNVYTTGVFQGTADFDPGAGTFNMTSAGDYDIYISKLDAAGNFVWAKQLGGTSLDWGYFITTDNSGNIYTTGAFYGTADFDPGAGTYNLNSTNATDVFISKLDASGNFVWAKKLGGTGQDVGGALAITASGNIYATGFFEETADFNPGAGTVNLTSAGKRDIFICKLDASGNYIWVNQLGGIDEDQSQSIVTDASGNVFTTGFFTGTADFNPGGATNNLTSAGGTDVFITKLNASGNFVWAKQFGGLGQDVGNAVVLDASGNIYTTGIFSVTADFNPGAAEFNLTSAGKRDAFIAKLDATGDLLWAKQFGSTGQDEGNSIDLDALGNILATGSFERTVDFDPGAGVSSVASAGSADIFISKLNSSGNFVWAKTMGGTGADYSVSNAVDASGNVYTTGYFEETAYFNPPDSNSKLTTVAASIDAFVHKLSGTSTGLRKNFPDDEISLYPNPTNGQVHITFSSELSQVQITVRNVLGQEISRKSYSAATFIHLSMEGNTGMYFVEVSSEDKKATFKIVKE